jgi:branched-chain amino acid transport system permease protein
VIVYMTWAILAFGFDLQFGTARVPNLCLIASMAIGAYVSAMMMIGPANPLLGETYLFGATLPFPVAWLGGALAGAALSLVVGLVVLPRLTTQFVAIVTLMLGVGMADFVSAYQPLFNGDVGISGVELPFSNNPIPTTGGMWVLAGLTTVCCGAAFLLDRRILASPLGRRIRASRDNEAAARSIGIDVTRLRLVVMGVGGFLAGLSGALVVSSVGAWSTSSWQLIEVVVVLTAVVLGGVGNPLGVMLGVLLFVIGIGQGIEFIPGLSGNGELSTDIYGAVSATLVIALLWWHPRGLIPERRYTTKESNLSPQRVAGPRASSEHEGDRSAVDVGSLTKHRGHERHVLSIDSLDVRFGGVVALRDCNMVMKPGATFLLGPNGAGKSTLVSCVAGSVRPQSGTVMLDESRLTGPPATRARRGITRTFQLPQEFGSLNVRENVMVALREEAGTNLLSALFGRRRWRIAEHRRLADADRILETCGLDHVALTTASTLSGGQKKLLELARALACEAEVLLLDEPTSGVAPILTPRVGDVLRRLIREGRTLVVVSHEMGFVQEIADEVVVMVEGTVVAQGKLAEVTTDDVVRDAFLGRAVGSQA